MDEQTTGHQDDDKDLANELDFLAAMRAYRSARESGDPEAIAAAEEAWREQVRGELKSCS